MTSPAPEEREACCRPPAASLDCPACGKKGRRVGSATLDQHLPPQARGRFRDAAGFCANPDCGVVYFDGDARALKGETLVAVAQKDPGEDVKVCYCFGYTRADIRRDLAARGATDIPDRIEREIAAGRCSCERSNPQGSCCLGNVVATVQAISRSLRKGA